MKKIFTQDYSIQILLFMFFYTAFMGNSFAEGKTDRVAIIPFIVTSGKPAWDLKELNQSIQDYMSKKSHIQVIDPLKVLDFLNKQIEKKGNSKSPCVDIACLMVMAKTLDCRKIITGEIITEFKVSKVMIKIFDRNKSSFDKTFGFSLPDKGNYLPIAKEIFVRFDENFSKKKIGQKKKDDEKSLDFRYNYDDIKKMMAKKKARSKKYQKTIKRKVDHPDFHSPEAAAFSCLLPFWSGSWNSGYNHWGLLLTGLKSVSFGLYLSFDNPMHSIAGISWAITMIADMLYTVYRIKAHNDDLSFEIILAIAPRFSYFESIDTKNGMGLNPIDKGLNLSFIYRF